MTGPTKSPRKLMPLFVDVTGRGVLVVGGGSVAERKATELVAAGASVRVIAKDVTDKLQALAASGDVVCEKRPFVDLDVDGAWLVVAATDAPEAQRAVALACDRARVFCIAVDDPENASAYGASVLRRGPLTVAISTSGEAPALARLLREILEQVLPEESWVEAARNLRETWKRDKTPLRSRFGDLVRAYKERAGGGGS